MSETLLIALIAGTVALLVASINTFVSESYKRFRDGSTVAASLAGELAAYKEAWPLLSEMLSSIINATEFEKPDLERLRPIERPKDLVYEKSIDRLGLLGANTAEGVVYVYSNINAFRIAFEIISLDHASMSKDELKARCIGCKSALERAVNKGEELLVTLHARANARFLSKYMWSY